MRVLILAYDFPPNGSIGGQRPYSWFKYFKEFGIHPVVVTRHWDTVATPEDTVKPCGTEVTITESDEGTLIRVPFRPNLRDRMLLRFGDRFSFVRKLLSLWFTLAQYFIPWADNRRNMLDAARAFLKENPCDAIIATGEPFILFRYGQLLSSEFRIPWVADYRDGWSTNYHAESCGMMDRLINRFFMQPIEKRLLRSCALATVAAPTLRDEIKELISYTRVELVMNGFFEEHFTNLSSTKKEIDRPFTIAYSGTLYPYQKAELFLEGILRLIRLHSISPSNLQVVFLGLNYQPNQVSRILRYHTDLAPYLRATDRMPYAQALERLASADLLLLLANRDFGQIYAKVFDYIALGKPVLMCEDDRGSLKTILELAGTGLLADSVEDVVAHVVRLMNEDTRMSHDQGRVQQFSRRHQTSILTTFLEDIARQ